MGVFNARSGHVTTELKSVPEARAWAMVTGGRETTVTSGSHCCVVIFTSWEVRPEQCTQVALIKLRALNEIRLGLEALGLLIRILIKMESIVPGPWYCVAGVLSGYVKTVSPRKPQPAESWDRPFRTQAITDSVVLPNSNNLQPTQSTSKGNFHHTLLS